MYKREDYGILAMRNREEYFKVFLGGVINKIESGRDNKRERVNYREGTYVGLTWRRRGGGYKWWWVKKGGFQCELFNRRILFNRPELHLDCLSIHQLSHTSVKFSQINQVCSSIITIFYFFLFSLCSL